jgi:integrase
MDFTPKPHMRNTADGTDASAWGQTYSVRHRPIRVTELPAGIEPPKKVRIYQRAEHYLLQWWDRSQKKTLSQRVDGDLVEAIVKARKIDALLAHFGSSGQPVRRLGHEQLITAYVEDLAKRADAGEIDPRTVERYRASLQCHYLAFVAQPKTAQRYRYTTDIDREFQLEFARFLQSRHVPANGNSRAATRPMRGQRYVIDVVRSMLHWASDSHRGNLLPAGFQNPFRRSNSQADRGGGQRLTEPEITMHMAAEFLLACDGFQLPIFATLALYGLRPNELGWIFREDIHAGWVHVIGHRELSYQTKGRRDKQFPILDCLKSIWIRPSSAEEGLLFYRRHKRVFFTPDASKKSVIAELQRRVSDESKFSAAKQRQLRDVVLNKAGQLHYDCIRTEFDNVSKHLSWPKCATVKDFRHLFATGLENANVPESYRRYLMGHSPGRAAIVTYTHLNKLQEHFMRAVESEFSPLVDAIHRCTAALQSASEPN